jgi:hypothetical protein
MTTQDFWRRVREIQRDLPAVVALISIENRIKGTTGGAFCQTDSELAAKLLIGRHPP